MLFRRILLSLCFSVIISLTTLYSQTNPQTSGSEQSSGTVSGMIVDANRNPIPYVTIYLLKTKDSLVVNGGITNDKGIFRIEEIPWGQYFLEINAMGYKKYQTIDFSLSPTTPRHRLGQFTIKERSTTLGEVEIVAKKEMIETNLDKTVFNVENSIVSEGATAVEVLTEVPAVDVDIEGNIQLRGSSNVTILIDGRPTELTLEEIPAAEIESIEVITNPSARFEPDGMGGIVNILLKKKRKIGFNALFSINGGTGIFRDKIFLDNSGANLNLNYSYNKINIFFSYNFRMHPHRNAGELDRYSWYLGDTVNLFQESTSRSDFMGNNVRLALDYIINTKNTLSFSVSYNRRDGDNSSSTDVTNSQVELGELTPYNRYTQNSWGNFSSNNYLANISYKKTFNVKGMELTADLFYTQRNSDNNSNALQEFMLYDGTPNYFQNTLTTSLNRTATGQIDFVTPVGNGGRIETGYKYSYRNIGQDYSLFYGEDEESVIEDFNQSNDFNYNEYLNALYFIYSNTFWKKFKIQLGLRGEVANTSSELHTYDTVYHKNYYNLFPTVHLRYDFNKIHSLQLSYSRRVTRPKFWDLNPFVNASDKLNLQMGNPNLTPEFANNIELSYSMTFKKSSLNFVAFYRQRSDLISRYTELHQAEVIGDVIYYYLPDDQIYTTPVTSEFDSISQFTYTLTSNQNINKSHSFGFELIYGQRFWKFWRINLNGSFYRTIIDSEDLIDPNLSKDWSWRFNLNQTFSLPKDWDIQLNFRFRSKSLTIGSMGFGSNGIGQGQRSANYSLNLGIKKSFFKRAFTISLNFRDLIFNPATYIHSYSYDTNNGYDSNSTRYRNSFQTTLTLTYKLNNFKNREEVISHPEENYDMQE